jgi:FMN phosphatase YigB (HAD superfamily)
MPRAVVWDFGNVIVRWDPRTLYTKVIPDAGARERFLAATSARWPGMPGPTAASASPTTPSGLVAEHPHHEAEIRAWYDRWDEMFSGAIPETEAAIEALHAGAASRSSASPTSPPRPGTACGP